MTPRRGVTLVEALTVLGLVAACIGGSIFFFNAFFGVDRLAAADAEARLAERRLFARLEDDLRQARAAAARGPALELTRPPDEAGSAETALVTVRYRLLPNAVERAEGESRTRFEFFPEGREEASLAISYELDTGRLRVRLRVRPLKEAAPFESARDFGMPAVTPDADGWKGIDAGR